MGRYLRRQHASSMLRFREHVVGNTFMAEPELVSGSTSMLTLNGGLKLYVLLHAAQRVSPRLQGDAQLPIMYSPPQALTLACTIAVVGAELGSGAQVTRAPGVASNCRQAGTEPCL